MARAFRFWRDSLIALAVLSQATSSAANGRFPRAQQVVEQPGNPDRIWLRATYGLLTTADRGKSWQFICEEAAGYEPSEDPSIALSGDGSLFAGTLAGLSLTRDTGCRFELFPGALQYNYVPDVTVEQADEHRVLVLVSSSDLGGQFLNQVWRSADQGRTFQQLGSNLPGDFLGLTLDPAPSDTRRIYVSGVFSTPGDGGVRLRARSYAATTTARAFSDSTSRVPASTTRRSSPRSIRKIPTWSGCGSTGDRADRLLRSSDGGRTYQELLRGQAELFGFALSPDGSTVLAGFGDPRDGTSVDPEKLGIWRSATSSIAFSRGFSAPVGCLGWTRAGVYACAFDSASGFELGFSGDEGRSFEPILRQAQLDGTSNCPAGTPAADLCPLSWPRNCRLFEICDAGNDSGGGGASASGGVPATGGSGGTPQADDEASCGCELGPRPGLNGFALALLALIGTLWFNAKRRARRVQSLPRARP